MKCSFLKFYVMRGAEIDFNDIAYVKVSSHHCASEIVYNSYGENHATETLDLTSVTYDLSKDFRTATGYFYDIALRKKRLTCTYADLKNEY